MIRQLNVVELAAMIGEKLATDGLLILYKTFYTKKGICLVNSSGKSGYVPKSSVTFRRTLD